MAVRSISGLVGDIAPHSFPQCGALHPNSRGPARVQGTTCEWTGSGAALASRGGAAVEIAPGLAIVADARIDNAADLGRELGLAPDASTEILIAAAYRRWGEDCPSHLEGDFAFAIWDAGEHRLLCARDPFGIRPLYYTHTGGSLRFAQSPGDLVRRAGSPPALRDEAIADYLYGRVIEAEGTFFEGVSRLPAGHVLVLREGELALRRYFHLAPAEPEGRDLHDQFRYLLDEAVRKRAAGTGQVGALLSGGLDSSAIACLLRDHQQAEGGGNVPVFSMVFREPERSNERPFVDHVLATGGFASRVLELDGYRPLDDLETLLEDCDGPTHAPNLACMRRAVGAANESGIGVLLDGHGGDEVVSHGYGLLGELAARGNWLSLWREARAAADNYGRSSLALTRQFAARQNRVDARILARLLAPLDRAPKVSGGGPAHLLSRDLIDRTAFKERLRSFAQPETAAGEQQQHHAVLTSALQPYAFEVHAAFYRSMGVEARYPFWDRRLVEFCLSLPAHEKLSGGWSRLVLRRAMAGIVPEPVLARRDKLDFTVHLARGLVVHHRDRIEALFADEPGNRLGDYCDLGVARSAFAAICADPDAAPGTQVQMVWRAIALGTWLTMLRASAPQPQSRPAVSGVAA
ncbi:asparagine synthase-related protein [Erythrobacter sp.]|uniref:asparagine synthase-related protein n=1 Tax=Erythrobacter sp. TaxID=1042 RepID=UPI0025EDD664|nr:asparagine synthase-related protein [Erythrobacter sp.]